MWQAAPVSIVECRCNPRLQSLPIIVARPCSVPGHGRLCRCADEVEFIVRGIRVIVCHSRFLEFGGRIRNAANDLEAVLGLDIRRRDAAYETFARAVGPPWAHEGQVDALIDASSVYDSSYAHYIDYGLFLRLIEPLRPKCQMCQARIAELQPVYACDPRAIELLAEQKYCSRACRDLFHRRRRIRERQQEREMTCLHEARRTLRRIRRFLKEQRNSPAAQRSRGAASTRAITSRTS